LQRKEREEHTVRGRATQKGNRFGDHLATSYIGEGESPTGKQGKMKITSRRTLERKKKGNIQQRRGEKSAKIATKKAPLLKSLV